MELAASLAKKVTVSVISDGYPTCFIGVRLMFGRSLHPGQHGSGREFGCNHSGRDGVHANAFVDQGQRHCARQLVDAALADVVAGNRRDRERGVD